MTQIYSLLYHQPDGFFKLLGTYLTQQLAESAKNSHCVTTKGPIGKYTIQQHTIVLNIK